MQKTHKTLMKGVGKDGNKWRNTPSSWFGRLSVQISILNHLIHGFKIILMKISVSYYLYLSIIDSEV